MAPRAFRHAIDDMLSEIDGINRAIAGKTIEDYATDWLLKHAIQRAIEIISEASRTIPPEAQAVRPEIPWPRVRGIGNILRHEYHGLSERIIWGVVTDELPRLQEALQAIRTSVDR